MEEDPGASPLSPWVQSFSSQFIQTQAMQGPRVWVSPIPQPLGFGERESLNLGDTFVHVYETAQLC